MSTSDTGEPGSASRVRATLRQPHFRKACWAGVAVARTVSVARSSGRCSRIRSCKAPAMPCRRHEGRTSSSTSAKRIVDTAHTSEPQVNWSARLDVIYSGRPSSQVRVHHSWSHKDPTYKTTLCGMLMIKERLLRVWLAYKRLTELSFPLRFPVVQFPNLPLIVALLAGEAGTFLGGSAHSYAASVSYLAMTIWAYEELVHGVNWFRRLLGLAYVILLVVRVAGALHP